MTLLPDQLLTHAEAVEAAVASLRAEIRGLEEKEAALLASDAEVDQVVAIALRHGLQDPRVDGCHRATHRQVTQALRTLHAWTGTPIAELAPRAADLDRKAKAIRSRIPADQEIQAAQAKVNELVDEVGQLDRPIRRAWSDLESAMLEAEDALRRIGKLQVTANSAIWQISDTAEGLVEAPRVKAYHPTDNVVSGIRAHEGIRVRASIIAKAVASRGETISPQAEAALNKVKRALNPEDRAA